MRERGGWPGFYQRQSAGAFYDKCRDCIFNVQKTEVKGVDFHGANVGSFRHWGDERSFLRCRIAKMPISGPRDNSAQKRPTQLMRRPKNYKTKQTMGKILEFDVATAKIEKSNIVPKKIFHFGRKPYSLRASRAITSF